jgi:hypothetical protein
VCKRYGIAVCAIAFFFSLQLFLSDPFSQLLAKNYCNPVIQELLHLIQEQVEECAVLYAITNTCQLNTKRKKEVICIQKLIHLGITILELLFSVFFKVLLLESWFIFFFEKPN